MKQEELDFFESLFYHGEDLGATYQKEGTLFAIWAPVDNQVFLKIKINDVFQLIEMKKEPKGISKIYVSGDLLNCPYHYLVKRDGQEIEFNDPYGKGVTLNSQYSAVVDIAKIKNSFSIPLSSRISSPTNAIIYEVGIRDFTSDKHSDIVSKGTYLGFIEEGRKTSKGNKAGLDYLLDLGVTHVQLNPVIDFANVDDNKKDTYNWGYDPISFFALEGSLAEDPNNPMSRLLEFKKMISLLHSKGIAVIMDVVYNHLFDYQNTCYQKAVPDYYFRQEKDGSAANGSGCGNEIASERKMVSKLIFDSIKYFIDVFDVDGFRFDLMGLIDVDTMNKISYYVHYKKPSALLYGEGWNMGNALPFEKRSCSENYQKLDNISFFNEHFRDALAGNVFAIDSPGFVMGNVSNLNFIASLFHGSRFDYPSRNINYVECHDNCTLFDRIFNCYYLHDDKKELALKRVNFANALVFLSCGIPFIHMGQEIGQSKFNLNNTYNVMKVNNLSYSLVDERQEMLHYFKTLVEMRKGLSYYSINDKEVLSSIVRYQTFHNGFISVTIKKEDAYPYDSGCTFIANPQEKAVEIDLEEYTYPYLVSGGIVKNSNMLVKRAFVPAITAAIFWRK